MSSARTRRLSSIAPDRPNKLPPVWRNPTRKRASKASRLSKAGSPPGRKRDILWPDLVFFAGVHSPGNVSAHKKRSTLILNPKELRLSEGTIKDATIINAPSSTKNREKKRDPRHALHEEWEPVLLRLGRSMSVWTGKAERSTASSPPPPMSVILVFEKTLDLLSGAGAEAP